MFKTITLKQGLTIFTFLALQACGFEQNFLGGTPNIPTSHNPPLSANDQLTLNSTTDIADSNGLTITGLCPPDETVIVTSTILDPNPQTFICPKDGYYSQVITFEDGHDGQTTVTVSALGFPSDSINVIVDTVTTVPDTTAPNPPTVVTPADGSLINSVSQTITGTCESGATVTIGGNITPGTATGLCIGGNYSINITLIAGDGVKNINLNQTDPANNTSIDISVSYTLDTNTNAPTVDSPTNGSILTSTSQTITGTCETGATVSITNDVVGSPVTGTCVGGAYSINVTLTSGDGIKHITAAQTDLAGNISADTDVNYTLDTATYTLGGTITGLPPGRSVEVTDIVSAQSFTITNNPNNYTGGYTFSTGVLNGSSYDVSLTVGLNNPFGYDDSHISCTMQNAQGTVSGANVTDINVVCECGSLAQQAFTKYFDEGTGTSGDPYNIYTIAQFENIANTPGSAANWGTGGSPLYYKQKCDFDFTPMIGTLLPIGDNTWGASLIWNGDLHYFRNYTNNDTDSDYAGAFGNHLQSEFRDMTLRDIQISPSGLGTAGIVGFIGYCEDCKFVNIYGLDIQVDGNTNSQYVGGLLGFSNSSSAVFHGVHLKNIDVSSPHGFLSALTAWGKTASLTHIMIEDTTVTDTDESDGDHCGAIGGFWDGPTLQISAVKNTTITCGVASGTLLDATNGFFDQVYFSGSVTSVLFPTSLLSGLMDGNIGVPITNSFISSSMTVPVGGFGNNVSISNNSLTNVSYNSDVGYGCQGAGTCTPDQPGVTPQPDTTKFYLSPANGGDASMNTWDFPNEWCEIPSDFPAVVKVPFSPCL